MLLVQVFKTAEGVRKRVAFENAHSKTHRFEAVRMFNGYVDTHSFEAERMLAYTWRIRKEKR